LKAVEASTAPDQLALDKSRDVLSAPRGSISTSDSDRDYYLFG
jgi:hypothetical protein